MILAACIWVGKLLNSALTATHMTDFKWIVSITAGIGALVAGTVLCLAFTDKTAIKRAVLGVTSGILVTVGAEVFVNQFVTRHRAPVNRH